MPPARKCYDHSLMHQPRIGLIGLGLVGAALAERFSGAFEVVGFDVDAEKAVALRKAGGSVADGPAQVAQQCERIVLSLPTSDVAASVLAQMQSVLAPGRVVIDTTTGEPEQMAGFGRDLAQHGILYLDASIGGSSAQVRSAQSIVICGGDPSAFEACRDVFSMFSRRVFLVEPSGSGGRMKLVLNLVLGLNRAALAEGLSYAAACGLDRDAALEILKDGPAYSRVMDTKGRKMLSGDFTPEARLSQHLKDVRLILAQGASHGARLPLTSLHAGLLSRLEAEGWGGEDNSAIIRAFYPENV